MFHRRWDQAWSLAVLFSWERNFAPLSYSFGWEYKPRSSLSTHAFKIKLGLKRSWCWCRGWYQCRLQKYTQHAFPENSEYGCPCGGIKNGHARKNPQSGQKIGLLLVSCSPVLPVTDECWRQRCWAVQSNVQRTPTNHNTMHHRHMIMSACRDMNGAGWRQYSSTRLGWHCEAYKGEEESYHIIYWDSFNLFKSFYFNIEI